MAVKGKLQFTFVVYSFLQKFIRVNVMVGSDIYDRRRVNMLKINTTAIERIVNQRQDIETIIVSGHTGTEKRGRS